MKPVFIGGCERSGTTMLGAMLGAHPRYLSPPEMPFKLDLLRSGSGNNQLKQADVRSKLEGDQKAQLQGWQIAEQKWAFDSAPASDVVVAIVQAYGAMHGLPNPGVWIDHTPNNIRWANTLATEFSDASFVHIVRDGRAVAASLMNLEWGPNTVFAAARYWLESLSAGLAAETALGARCIRTRYEDLVSEPETELRKLCSGLGIEFDQAMVDGGGFEVSSYSKGQHALVGSAPDPNRALAWKQQLSPREIEIFEAAVGDVLPLLEYEPQVGMAAIPATRTERLSGELKDLFRRRVINRVRKRSRIKNARRGES